MDQREERLRPERDESYHPSRMRMSVPARACDGPCPALITCLLRLFWKARWRLLIPGPACFFPVRRVMGWRGSGGSRGEGGRGGSSGRHFSDLERGTNAWEVELSDAEWLDRAKPLELSVVQAPRNPLDLAIGSPSLQTLDHHWPHGRKQAARAS